MIAKRYSIVITIVFFIISWFEILSQPADTSSRIRLSSKNPEGTEFWLCFMKNHKELETVTISNELHLELFITGDFDTEINLEIRSINFKKNIFLRGGTVENIKIDPRAQLLSSEVIERNHALRITSAKPISVYGLNRRFQTTDTYLCLPVNVLGMEYRAMCYNLSDGLTSEFAIVAVENGTVVEINPTVNTVQHDANKPFRVLLNQGDVYQVAARFELRSRCDLTGSLISSNKKIAVFSGHQCAYVPSKFIACNHLAEQLPPIPSWGKHFYLGRFQKRSNYTYRVLANDSNTKVFEDNKLIKKLNPGEFIEKEINKNVQITADKPILVAQYSQGFKNGDSIGDPMMLLVSPTQQFLKKYRFSTPVNGSWDHYVNVIVPTNSISSMRLNGLNVDTNLFEQLGLSRYSIGYLEVPFGSHVITCDQPFGMYSYGFGFGPDAFDAYGTMGGQSFLEYEFLLDSIPPMAELKYLNQRMMVIIRDDRIDDTGINEVKILSTQGIESFIPPIEPGIPQVSITLRPVNVQEYGRLVLQASDVVNNTSVYSICYTFNPKTEAYEFTISEGDNADCSIDPGFQFGVFGKFSGVFHSADFSSTGNLSTNGTFNDALGTGGYAGLLIGRRFTYYLTLSARISVENYGGVLEAADTNKIRILDTATKTFIDFQESSLLELGGSYLHFSLASEYFFQNDFYLLGGINLAFLLSDAITFRRKIVIPENRAYDPSGSRTRVPPNAPKELSSLNLLRLGVFIGVGLTMPLNKNISLFTEGIFTHHFSSVIDNSNWLINQLSFLLGLRIRT